MHDCEWRRLALALAGVTPDLLAAVVRLADLDTGDTTPLPVSTARLSDAVIAEAHRPRDASAH